MRNVLTAAIAPTIWGTTYLVTTQFLPADRPLLTAALRALPIGLLMLLLLRRLPSGDWWWRSLVLGALNIGVFFALLFIATYRLPGGIAATIGSISPFIVALLAWPLLGDRPTLLSIGAALSGVAGVALLVIGPTAKLDFIGVLAALASACTSALGVVLTKRWGRPVPLLVFTSWQLVAGGLLLAIVALWAEGPPPQFTTANYLGYAYLGLISTGLAYILWFRGIERLPASAVSILALLSPTVAVLLDFFIKGRSLSLLQLLGAGLVLVSIVVMQTASIRQQRSKQQAMLIDRATIASEG